MFHHQQEPLCPGLYYLSGGAATLVREIRHHVFLLRRALVLTRVRERDSCFLFWFLWSFRLALFFLKLEFWGKPDCYIAPFGHHAYTMFLRFSESIDKGYMCTYMEFCLRRKSQMQSFAFFFLLLIKIVIFTHVCANILTCTYIHGICQHWNKSRQSIFQLPGPAALACIEAHAIRRRVCKLEPAQPVTSPFHLVGSARRCITRLIASRGFSTRNKVCVYIDEFYSDRASAHAKCRCETTCCT